MIFNFNNRQSGDFVIFCRRHKLLEGRAEGWRRRAASSSRVGKQKRVNLAMGAVQCKSVNYGGGY